ncbi:lipoyl(octanoyl) transferase LipB [bacterium]|nr:lipoyl(octanoyl) transferase LipB [bacterium]
MGAIAAATGAVAAPPLQVRRLGRRPYEEVLALQEDLLARVAAGGPETVLLLEHPPVYTLGRGADAADLRGAPERLGVPWVRVGRGGGATFHGPGQLVAYPIVRLRAAGRDVSGYVCALERALIDTCAAFGVAARAPSGQIGVWAGGRKIASVGIGVRRGVAYHGIALNVATDLAYFDAITVCRSDGLRLINLGALCTPPPALDAVGDAFARALAARLDRAIAEVP